MTTAITAAGEDASPTITIDNEDIFVVSDLHLSDPKEPQLENFRSDREFETFVTRFIPERAGGRRASLVIAGDFVDFVRIAPWNSESEERAIGSTEAVSVEKVRKAIVGHPAVFDALRRHVAGGQQLILLAGNHDVDMFWPDVQNEVRAAFGNSSKVVFGDTWSIRGRGIYVEHGHQYSYDNRFEHFLPFDATKTHLERAWGTFFMESVYNEIEYFAPWINKVHPTSKAIALALGNLDWQRLPPVLAGKLLGFFLSHGKRMIIRHALHTPSTSNVIPSTSNFRTRSEAATALGFELKSVPEDVWQLAEQLARPQAHRVGANGDREPQPRGQSLGHNDERSLKRAAHKRLKEEGVHTVIFGHTHRAHRTEVETGTKVWINTGTWTGHIPIPEDKRPTFEELTAAVDKPTHKRTYAYVGPAAIPGALETYPPI